MICVHTWHAYAQVHVHVRACVCAHTQTHIQTHTQIHIQTHTHTHTLTDKHLWLVQSLQSLPHDLVPYWTPDNFWQQDPYSMNTPTLLSGVTVAVYTTCAQSVESPNILLH